MASKRNDTVTREVVKEAAKRISHLMCLQGLNEKSLGVSRATAYRAIQGETEPTPGTITEIAKNLGVDEKQINSNRKSEWTDIQTLKSQLSKAHITPVDAEHQVDINLDILEFCLEKQAYKWNTSCNNASLINSLAKLLVQFIKSCLNYKEQIRADKLLEYSCLLMEMSWLRMNLLELNKIGRKGAKLAIEKLGVEAVPDLAFYGMVHTFANSDDCLYTWPITRSL
jgi:transcriptional regulator with XRE-family HTH domain